MSLVQHKTRKYILVNQYLGRLHRKKISFHILAEDKH